MVIFFFFFCFIFLCFSGSLLIGPLHLDDSINENTNQDGVKLNRKCVSSGRSKKRRSVSFVLQDDKTCDSDTKTGDIYIKPGNSDTKPGESDTKPARSATSAAKLQGATTSAEDKTKDKSNDNKQVDIAVNDKVEKPKPTTPTDCSKVDKSKVKILDVVIRADELSKEVKETDKADVKFIRKRNSTTRASREVLSPDGNISQMVVGDSDVDNDGDLSTNRSPSETELSELQIEADVTIAAKKNPTIQTSEIKTSVSSVSEIACTDSQIEKGGDAATGEIGASRSQIHENQDQGDLRGSFQDIPIVSEIQGFAKDLPDDVMCVEETQNLSQLFAPKRLFKQTKKLVPNQNRKSSQRHVSETKEGTKMSNQADMSVNEDISSNSITECTASQPPNVQAPVAPDNGSQQSDIPASHNESNTSLSAANLTGPKTIATSNTTPTSLPIAKISISDTCSDPGPIRASRKGRKRTRRSRQLTTSDISMKDVVQNSQSSQEGNHTWIEGLIYPVEYYVRKTRSMSGKASPAIYSENLLTGAIDGIEHLSQGRDRRRHQQKGRSTQDVSSRVDVGISSEEAKDVTNSSALKTETKTVGSHCENISKEMSVNKPVPCQVEETTPTTKRGESQENPEFNLQVPSQNSIKMSVNRPVLCELETTKPTTKHGESQEDSEFDLKVPSQNSIEMSVNRPVPCELETTKPTTKHGESQEDSELNLKVPPQNSVGTGQLTESDESIKETQLLIEPTSVNSSVSSQSSNNSNRSGRRNLSLSRKRRGLKKVNNISVDQNVLSPDELKVTKQNIIDVGQSGNGVHQSGVLSGQQTTQELNKEMGKEVKQDSHSDVNYKADLVSNDRSILPELSTEIKNQILSQTVDFALPDSQYEDMKLARVQMDVVDESQPMEEDNSAHFLSAGTNPASEEVNASNRSKSEEDTKGEHPSDLHRSETKTNSDDFAVPSNMHNSHPPKTTNTADEFQTQMITDHRKPPRRKKSAKPSSQQSQGVLESQFSQTQFVPDGTPIFPHMGCSPGSPTSGVQPTLMLSPTCDVITKPSIMLSPTSPSDAGTMSFSPRHCSPTNTLQFDEDGMSEESHWRDECASDNDAQIKSNEVSAHAQLMEENEPGKEILLKPDSVPSNISSKEPSYARYNSSESDESTGRSGHSPRRPDSKLELTRESSSKTGDGTFDRRIPLPNKEYSPSGKPDPIPLNLPSQKKPGLIRESSSESEDATCGRQGISADEEYSPPNDGVITPPMTSGNINHTSPFADVATATPYGKAEVPRCQSQCDPHQGDAEEEEGMLQSGDDDEITGFKFAGCLQVRQTFTLNHFGIK